MQLTKPLTFVLFSPDRPNGIQLPDLPPNVVPILPNNKIAPMRITVNSKWFTVSHLQLRLLPGWAMTIDKCQGQNMPKSITDLSSLPSAGNRLTASHVYVALSRSQGRDDLRMLRCTLAAHYEATEKLAASRLPCKHPPHTRLEPEHTVNAPITRANLLTRTCGYCTPELRY